MGLRSRDTEHLSQTLNPFILVAGKDVELMGRREFCKGLPGARTERFAKLESRDKLSLASEFA